MAPLLVSLDDPPKPRRVTPIIPAIPRTLESIRQASGAGSAGALNGVKQEKAAKAMDGSGDWASMVAEDEASQETREKQQHAAAYEEDEKLCFSPSLHQSAVSPVHNLTMPSHVAPYTPCRPEYIITFGGYAESIDSSPSLPASAASTAYTHPTPLSDAASQNSQYQRNGNGHYVRQFGSFVPPDAMLSSGFAPVAQPVFAPWQNINGSVPGRDFVPNGHPVVARPRAMSYKHATAQDLDQLERENVQALRAHLLGQFNDSRTADCHLHLKVRNQEVDLLLHSVVVSQSPVIRGLLQSVGELDRDGRKELRLETRDPFVSPLSLEYALRSCYGDSPIKIFYFDQSQKPPGEKASMMDTALACLAAGRLLQLPGIAQAGYRFALRSFDQASLEKVITFTLRGSSGAGTEGKGSGYDELAEFADGDYAPHSHKLLVEALAFMATILPGDFFLDTAAPAMPGLGGFPASTDMEVQFESKPEASPSGVSLVRFGSFPPTPDAQTSTLSSILLSVPFAVLRRLLGHFVYPQLAQEVIREREKRRLGFLERNRGPSADGETRAGWRESIAVAEGAGVVIQRAWAGFDA